jgi:putative sigma-54 modulation protein
MQLSTTFRHMDASQAVREYAGDKLDKIRKYFQKEMISAHAVFSIERGYQHVAELNITLPNGILINAKESTEDMYSSIDLAAARIERQVRKWKDKIRDHKPHHGPQVSIRETIISADEFDPRPTSDSAPPSVPRPAPAPAFNVVKEETYTVRPMRVDDAVMQLNLIGTELLMFHNIETQAIAVVYRRKDGHYGLIEASGPRVEN